MTLQICTYWLFVYLLTYSFCAEYVELTIFAFCPKQNDLPYVQILRVFFFSVTKRHCISTILGFIMFCKDVIMDLDFWGRTYSYF